MTDYSNGKNVLLKRPEPGRPIHSVEKQEIVAHAPIDTNAIADAVIKAIVSKMPAGGMMTESATVDSFDSSSSMARLADAMSATKGNEGNIGGIGIIKETKKDTKETNKTIDLLSKLGD